MGVAEQVLVVYLGDMQWKWLPFNTLLPFQKHRQEKVAEAEGLIAAKRLTKPILFNKALNVSCFCVYPHKGMCSWLLAITNTISDKATSLRCLLAITPGNKTVKVCVMASGRPNMDCCTNSCQTALYDPREARA